ncbi:MAG: AAA family ATPase [Chloroflexi bacterium]|nr:AAA family ATPase [Chloroflexota bacterium]
MPVTKIKLENFTAFKDLEVEFSPGINALVGANGTGKTHLMKACYAACDVFKTGDNFAQKLIGVFLPSGRSGGRLVHRRDEETQGIVQVYRGTLLLEATFKDRSTSSTGVKVGEDDSPLESVYIPVKEVLANAPGFLSLYSAREVHFEEVYEDILLRVYLPALREPIDKAHERMLNNLENVIGGSVSVSGEEFFLSNEHGDLEFSLLAEGWRKLGLLWLLIRNGTLRDGSVLFWDEPEANLNPKMFRVVIEVLLELQRAGVQVFFATHNYVILKELDLQMKEENAVAFHSLYRDEDGEIACHTTNRYLDISPNAIDEAFDDLYDREIERSLGGLNG